MRRDGEQQSIWQRVEGIKDHGPQISSGEIVDVLIVGGGITGCSTALELAKAGLKCLLVEAHDIGFGTTGGTTAHLNTILDHPYPEITSKFGNGASRLVAIGLRAALDHVARNVSTYHIECGHGVRDAELFSQNDPQSDTLVEMHKASTEAGVAVAWSDHLSIKRPYDKVLLIKDQAQFHPLLYIQGLIKAYQELGGAVLRNCRVTQVEEGEPLTVSTSKGEFKAKHLIYATHIPPGVNLLHFRCAPYRSYAMAVKLADDGHPQGLAYDMEEAYHYYRSQVIDGIKWLIAGGKDHKTGHEENTRKPFEELEEHIRQYFNVEKIGAQWSSQYFEPADGLPYIGTLPGYGDQVMVATGFSGNGMTLGTLSAIALTERITTGYSPYLELFDPKRVKPVAGFKKFVKENADVVAHMISKPFLADKIEGLQEIPNGEGRLVKYEGEQLGIYRDEAGKIHMVKTICPHAKCTVKWNQAERSWDCPCHGSRFSVNGQMLTGPSTKDLEHVNEQLRT